MGKEEKRLKAEAADSRFKAAETFKRQMTRGLESQLEKIEESKDTRFASIYLKHAITQYLSALKAFEPNWVNSLNILKESTKLLALKKILDSISYNWFPILFHPELVDDTWVLRADDHALKLLIYLKEKATEFGDKFSGIKIAGYKVDEKCKEYVTKIQRLIEQTQRSIHLTRALSTSALNLRTRLIYIEKLTPENDIDLIEADIGHTLALLEDDDFVSEANYLARQPNKEKTICNQKKLLKKYDSYLQLIRTNTDDLTFKKIKSAFLTTPLVVTHDIRDIIKLVAMRIQDILRPLFSEREVTGIISPLHERLQAVCRKHRIHLPPLQQTHWLQIPGMPTGKMSPIDQWVIDILKDLSTLYWKIQEIGHTLQRQTGRAWIQAFLTACQQLALATQTQFDLKSKSIIIVIQTQKIHALLQQDMFREYAMSEHIESMCQRLSYNNQSALKYLISPDLYHRILAESQDSCFIIEDELSRYANVLILNLLSMATLLPSRALDEERTMALVNHRQIFMGTIIAAIGVQIPLDFNARRQQMLEMLTNLPVMMMRFGGTATSNRTQAAFFEAFSTLLNSEQFERRYPAQPLAIEAPLADRTALSTEQQFQRASAIRRGAHKVMKRLHLAQSNNHPRNERRKHKWPLSKAPKLPNLFGKKPRNKATHGQTTNREADSPQTDIAAALH